MEDDASVLSQLRSGDITINDALELLVSKDRLVSLHLIDLDVVKRFSESVRRYLRKNSYLPPVVPLLLWRNCYYLGSPIGLSDTEIVDLKLMLKTDINIIPIAEKSYRNWFRCFEVKEILENLDPGYVSLLSEVESEQDMTEAAEAALTFAFNQTDRIRSLVTQAVNLRASDIHLEPNVSGLTVRFRIDGILRDITSFSSEVGRRIVVAIKVMSEMNIAETRRPQDGRISNTFAVGLQELDVSIRVSTLPCVVPKTNNPSEKVVMRLLRQKNSFTAIEDLGFSELAATIYRQWTRQPQGIIIFTGPTGSGKTSTLYTTLQTIATREKNISTIEDPVEYSIAGVTQTQVLEAAGMTFAAGLRSILRQDPDVVMVGEIRDADTAITAVRAALTGHLVLTTLHSNDALGAIPRLKNLGVDPGLISDALLGIVSQRLIRRICPYCQTSYRPTHFQLNVFDAPDREMESWNWQKGQGCVKCFNSGYLGREGIFELLNVDEFVRSAIQRYDLEELRQYVIDFDELSFRRAAMEKVKEGITDIEEILRVLPESSIGTQKRSHKTRADVEINADFIGLKANEQNLEADFISMSSQEASATTPQNPSLVDSSEDPWADINYNSIPNVDYEDNLWQELESELNDLSIITDPPLEDVFSQDAEVLPNYIPSVIPLDSYVTEQNNDWQSTIPANNFDDNIETSEELSMALKELEDEYVHNFLEFTQDGFVLTKKEDNLQEELGNSYGDIAQEEQNDETIYAEERTEQSLSCNSPLAENDQSTSEILLNLGTEFYPSQGQENQFISEGEEAADKDSIESSMPQQNALELSQTSAIIPATYTDDFMPFTLEEATVIMQTSKGNLQQQIETVTNPDRYPFTNDQSSTEIGFFVDYEDSQMQEVFNQLIESNSEELIENLTIDFNILLEDVVYKIRTRYDKTMRTRMKKLLLAVCTGNWPDRSQDLNSFSFSYLIEKTLQMYPKKSTLESCLRIIVRNLNKSQIYEDIVELLLDRFHEIYYLQEWRQLLTSRPQAELSDH